MSEELNDANTGDNTASTESSSDVELKPIIDDEGLFSTTEYERVEKDTTDQEADTDTDNSDGAETNTPEGQSEKQDFHEHPRFKELIDEKNQLKQELTEIKKQISQPKEPEQQNQTETPKFRNVLEMEDEAITDEIVNSPKEFLVNFAQQLAHELKGNLSAEAKAKEQQSAQETYQGQAKKNYQAFFEGKEDGQAMLNDGRIEQYMRANPGHNPISAYYALAGETLTQKQIDEAVQKERDKIFKELKAKGTAKSQFSSTPSNRALSDTKSPEMQNSGKFGGRNNVLLKRLLNRAS